MDELDELVSLFGNDSAVIREAIGRNPAAAAALQSRQQVFKTFVEGDQSGLTDAVTRAQAHHTAQTTQVRTAQFDLNQLDAELNTRLDSRLKTFTESPEFGNLVETRAKTIAEQQIQARMGDIIGRSAKLSDEIYTVRSNHSREFGTELDTKAFEAFLEGKNFGSISAAHDVFVQDERVNKRIAEGVRAGVAAQQTTQVPGTSLPTSQTPLGAMMRANPANVQTAARGEGLDAAVVAFRALQARHANG
jgi:hypothetical protein